MPGQSLVGAPARSVVVPRVALAHSWGLAHDAEEERRLLRTPAFGEPRSLANTHSESGGWSGSSKQVDSLGGGATTITLNMGVRASQKRKFTAAPAAQPHTLHREHASHTGNAE